MARPLLDHSHELTIDRANAKGSDMGENAAKDVFNIVEGKDGKERWVKIGQAFINKDGSINAYLDVFPRDGKLQIRERRVSERNGNGRENRNDN